MMNRMMTPKIKDYYGGTTVLVTGGTGCIGKAVIEKLLRTCKDIKQIYVILRDKKGKSSEERFKTLKTNQVRPFRNYRSYSNKLTFHVFNA